MSEKKTVYCLVWHYYDDHEVVAVSKTIEGARKVLEKLDARANDRGYYQVEPAKLFDSITSIDDYYGLSDENE